jgi:hypothetical protein
MTITWQVELENARRARLEGKEGMARVCARRAAGAAARDFLTRRGVRLWTASAYDALRALEHFHGLTPDLRSAASRLTLRVTDKFALPSDIDLIADAQTLITGLTADGTTP